MLVHAIFGRVGCLKKCVLYTCENIGNYGWPYGIIPISKHMVNNMLCMNVLTMKYSKNFILFSLSMMGL